MIFRSAYNIAVKFGFVGNINMRLFDFNPTKLKYTK